jgi:hypothetical protein
VEKEGNLKRKMLVVLVHKGHPKAMVKVKITGIFFN